MKKALSTVLAAVMLAGSIGVVPPAAAAAVGDTWKFDFGAAGQIAAEGYYSVTPETEFNGNTVDGLQFGLYGQNENDYKLKNYEDGVKTKQGQYYNYTAQGDEAAATDDRIGIGELPEGQIDGLYPIRFAMEAENNSYYRVKVYVTTLDGSRPATGVNVYSERRHPIVTNKTVAAGETESVEFTTTIQSVLVKDRANGGTITYNDNKLNVMAVGENAAVSAIEVEKIEPATTVWCYNDSTGCDYPMSLPYFPLQNYGGTAQFLSKYLPKDVALVNQGDGGIAANATSYFKLCRDNIKAGDYIYLQYGHNHKNDGPAGYVQYLAQYYEWAHQKGAYMVYVGPIDRHNESQYDASTNTWSSTLNGFSKAAKYYTELTVCGGIELAKEFAAKIKAEGGKNISAEIYAWADEQIAKGITKDGAKDVAFIDLNQPTLDWLSEVCEEVKVQQGSDSYSSRFSDYYFHAELGSSVDGTHENDYGADATASFFFEGINALQVKADKTPVEEVQANVLAPLVNGMRVADWDHVPEEVVRAGNAPNSMYPAVFKSSNIAELPLNITGIEWNSDNTIASVKIAKQEAQLFMDSYGKLELIVKSPEGNVKGTIVSTQIDNTWDDGSVNVFTTTDETNRLTGDTAVTYDKAAGDTFTAIAYKALDDENQGLIFDETTGARIPYSGYYEETDVIAALVPNEDGNAVEDFNFYGVKYDGTSTIHGVNNWSVYGSAGGKDTNLHQDGGRYYTNVIKDSNSTSFALSKKLSQNLGTTGRVSLSVDLRTTGLGNINIGLANQGTQFPDKTIYIISIDGSGNVYAYGNTGEAAVTLSTTEWTTVTAELDIDMGTISVTANGKTVTADVPAYQTNSAEVVPSSLSHMHFGMNAGNKSGGIQVSNLQVLKKKPSEDLPSYTMSAVSNNTEYGTVECISRGGVINTPVTVKAAPVSGMRFVNWKDSQGNILSENPEYTFRLRGDTRLTAYFGNGALVNAVDEKGAVLQELVNTAGVPGEKYVVEALPRVIEKDGTFYELEPGQDGKRTYAKSFTMGNNGDEVQNVVYKKNPQMVYFAEGETATRSGVKSPEEKSGNQYSSGKAFAWTQTGSYIEFPVTLEEAGVYEIAYMQDARAASNGKPYATILSDGDTELATFGGSTTELKEYKTEQTLEAGEHKIRCKVSYSAVGAIDYLYLVKVDGGDPPVVPTVPPTTPPGGDDVREFTYTNDTSFAQEQVLGTDFVKGLYDITFTKADTSRADIFVNGTMAANNVDMKGYNRTVSTPSTITVHGIEVTDGMLAVSMADTNKPYLSYIKVEKVKDRKTKVFVIGDSLAANYYGNTSNENKAQSGWGQVMANFFTSDVEVVNLANGGHYATILYETAFPGVLAHGKKGDYVIIESGYNDNKYNTAEVTAEYVEKMANEAKEKGIIPVIVSPNASPHQCDGSAAYQECFDDYSPTVHFTEAMQQAAEKADAYYIDLAGQSYDYYNTYYGEDRDAIAETYTFTDQNNDTLHHNTVGAMNCARIIAQGMNDLGINHFINTDYSFSFTDAYHRKITYGVNHLDVGAIPVVKKTDLANNPILNGHISNAADSAKEETVVVDDIVSVQFAAGSGGVTTNVSSSGNGLDLRNDNSAVIITAPYDGTIVINVKMRDNCTVYLTEESSNTGGTELKSGTSDFADVSIDVKAGRIYRLYNSGSGVASIKNVTYTYEQGSEHPDVSIAGMVSAADGKYTVKAKTNNCTEGMIICAMYKDGQLVGIKTKNNTGAQEVFELTTAAEPDHIKLMLWDGVESMVPLCEAVSIDKSQWNKMI